MADRSRIRIWHPYPIDLVRSGARKPERRVAAAPIDVDVRTVEPADLAVASRFRASTSYQTWEGKLAGGPEIELHGFDGALWTPLPGPEGTAAATLEQWQGAMAGGPQLPDPYEISDPILGAQYAAPYGFVSGWDGVVRLERTEGRVVAEDRRSAMAAAIRAADDVLLVGGRVWCRASPPFWSVERDGNHHMVFMRWHRTAKDRFHFPGANVLGTFAADRLEDAMAYARDIAAARGRRAEVRGPGGACLEHVPEHAGRDDRVANALELGGPVVAKLGGLAGALSNVGVEAYVEARTLLGRLAAGDGDAETVAQMAAAFATAADDLDRFDFPIGSWDPRDDLKRDALKTFNSRMNRFDAEPEAAPSHPKL
jgi:hypothetical protein